VIKRLRSRARALRNETFAVYIAAKDPRTPWYAKAIAICTAAYVFSPIDLIPDFVPVLGYLDDLIIVPAGIALAIRLIPADVMEDARSKVTGTSLERGTGYVGAVVILLVWIVILFGVLRLIKFLS